MIERKRISISGLAVSFLIRPVEKPLATILFIHGFPFDARMWETQFPDLPPTIQAIALDLRGCGQSEAGQSYFTIDLFARDVLSFIEELDLEQVIICGISMGGYVALRMAERAPEALSGFILCDTNAHADPDKSKLNRFSSIEQILRGEKRVFADRFVENVLCPASFQDNAPLVSFVKEMILNTPDATICSTLLALASRTDTTTVLDQIAVPALVIRGMEDKLMSSDEAMKLHRGIRSSEIIEIPAAGHLPNLENSPAFNSALRTFLQKHFSA